MAKISKALFALMLSCVLSFSTVASSLPVLADEIEQTTEENESENVQETTTDKSDTEVSEPVENTENNVSQEEVLGSSDMMDYFLVNMPIVNSNDTQKLVLSLKNVEGYSNFKVSVKKSDGTSFDMEATSQEGNLVEFSRVFTEKGEYTVTTLHYVYNGQAYYLNLGDLDMDVKFGVDQEYSGYDPSLPDLTAGTTSDEGVVQVTDLNNVEEQVEDGILSSSAASAIATIGEDINSRASKEVTICLDPGHGGSDGGAIAVNGANEKDLTLKIAKYCKQELEKYDCKVIMTRYDDRDVDLKERAIIARNNGADYLISIHLNSSSPGAMGAEVYYPNSNYRPDLGQNGQAVAQSIQNELAALGIYNRGIKIRNLDPGEMPYPDGSIGDYYAVIRHAKNFGMTGMIIEHCFLSNSSDFYNFLSSDSRLQALGIADAKGIVNALGLAESRDAIDQFAKDNRNALADGDYEIASNLDSDYVLDITSSSTLNGANAQLYEANGSKAQAFSVSHDKQGYITITNKNSGKVLEAASDRAGNYTNVRQNQADGSYRQKWIAVKKNDGSYEIVSALSKYYCLDLYGSRTVDGNNVDLFQRNDSTAQQWIFRTQENPRDALDQLAAENKDVLADGSYEIASKLNMDYVLDMASSSLSNGGNVQLYESNETPAQGWIVSHDSQGYVIIKNENSGKLMEVKDDHVSNHANVVQNEKNNRYGQKWIVVKNGDGSFQVVSALNKDYCLNLNASSASSGSNVDVYQSNGSNAQKWMFTQKVSQREYLDQLAAENKNALADGQYTISTKLNTKYVLDIYFSSKNNGGNVQLYEGNGTKAQSFTVSHDSKGYVTITNVNSGKVIEVNGDSAADLTNIQQNTSNDSYRQKWIAIKNTDGSIELVSALNKRFCMDLYSSRTVSGNNVDLYQRNNSNAQKWIFKKKTDSNLAPSNYDAIAAQNKGVLADGKYEIASKLNTGYVLDMYFSSKANGGNVQLYESNGTKAQCWSVSHDSKGYVIITNENSGKVMEVAGNKAGNLVNVQQNQANENMSQKWIALKKNDGSIELVSALNMNYCLDLYSSQTVNGNNVEIYERNDSNAQLWKFQKYETEQEKANRLAKENENLMQDGIYFIKNVNTQYVLDVPSSSKNPGVNIQLYTLNESNAQKWVIEHDSNGYVSFMNFGSKLYLTASNGKVTQEYGTNEANQKWILCFDTQGRLKIVSATDTKLAMDVVSSNFSNGARIQTYSSNNTSAQQWVFTYISEYKPENVFTNIMGKSLATVDQMVNYYNANASGYDTFKGKYEGKYDGCLAEGGASTIREFAQIFYEEASAEGVRAEVAFVQCMKETAFLKYGGDVLPNQYNYAGIGATGAIHGAAFKDVRTGIRAQIQHLKAYASLDRLVNTCVDPRFNLVTRGCAEYVEWLGQQENPNGYGWATDKNYGYSIVDMMSVLLNK